MKRVLGLAIVFLCSLSACKDHAWNNPNKVSFDPDVRYASFAESPKTLDPAKSYGVDEGTFISQIYEPPLQYHYLKRPFMLVPLAAVQMPKVIYLDANGRELSANADPSKVAFTKYIIQIKPNMLYQPHPAFAKDVQGNYRYFNLTKKELNHIHGLKDFKETGTRELTADDYVYEIKRLANPKVGSPIFGVMEKYIVGFPQYAEMLNKLKTTDDYIDLRQYPLVGAKSLDRYTYEITIQKQYPQFPYWLAMNFFAPIPWEADKFYSQPGMKQSNLSFDWYPVGTGPYMLTENNPNSQMILERNPNFHGETYPSEGMAEDQAAGLLAAAGKPMPFVDKWIYSLEKETIPRWNKFLQGYYDVSAISSDSFEQAIHVDDRGQPQLTREMQQKNIRLQTNVEPTVFFFGFNMQDNIVGGDSERARKLRQAISIAFNIEEYISIFLNGRGIPAQGPIPPGIFGYQENAAGVNPYVYDWVNNKPKRKPLAAAKQLMLEAGYPNGRDAKTGEPLILNFDTVATAAGDNSFFDWIREQFRKLGIQVNIRATQYNRFQEKMRTGNTQIYYWGWQADYPDPENFLFLLYGPNSKVKFNGENTSNYSNPEFDRLFEQMKLMPNGPERENVIQQMLTILRKDAPWIWGLHLKEFALMHQWVGPVKQDALGHNILKYQSVNAELRRQKQAEWNRPHYWPLVILFLLLVLVLFPVFLQYRRRLHAPRMKRLK